MIARRPPPRILLFAEPTDMRKGHYGLQGLVLAAGEDPFGGDLLPAPAHRDHLDRSIVITSIGHRDHLDRSS